MLALDMLACPGWRGRLRLLATTEDGPNPPAQRATPFDDPNSLFESMGSSKPSRVRQASLRDTLRLGARS